MHVRGCRYEDGEGGGLPCCTNDGETNAEPDTQVCPGVGGDVFKELSDLDMELATSSIVGRERAYIECFSIASKEHI